MKGSNTRETVENVGGDYTALRHVRRRQTLRSSTIAIESTVDDRGADLEHHSRRSQAAGLAKIPTFWTVSWWLGAAGFRRIPPCRLLRVAARRGQLNLALS